MLQSVDVGRRTLDSYRGVASDSLIEELRRRAEPLRGLRVLQINATPYGGGVSELLRSAVPLMNDLGIMADWKIISGDDAFFQVTKAIHNGLQGAERALSDHEREVFRANTERNATLLEEDYDIIVLHDPQTAGLLQMHGKDHARWVWRCHIDTSKPNPGIWTFIKDFLVDYDAAVFTMAEFVPPDLPIERVEIIPPAIDPLSPKNLLLDDRTARQVLDWIGVQLNRPLVTQVSRFDPWKDPLGVIQAYRLARERVPELQLALVGSMALDDPEGWEIYRQINAARANDPLIHVFTNLTGVGNIEVNAFQRLSDVVVQKSIREGFGLVVSEALWKGTPVVAGRVGGIPLQMADGVGGALVDSNEETAAAIVRLLKEPERTSRLAESGRARVRDHFLLPRLLLNELSLIGALVNERPSTRDWSHEGVVRDPVCGMALEAEERGARSATYQGREFLFCSEYCEFRFRSDPERYVSTGSS